MRKYIIFGLLNTLRKQKRPFVSEDNDGIPTLSFQAGTASDAHE